VFLRCAGGGPTYRTALEEALGAKF